MRLLNRTTRAVSLTDAGERFLGGARRVLADLTEIEQAAAGQGSAPRGELAVTAPILFGRLHVLPIVTEFMRAFPDVTARLMLLDRPVDLIEERLDAAIRIGHARGLKRDRDAGSAACAASWSRRRPIWRGAARRSARRISRRTTSSCSAGSGRRSGISARTVRCRLSPRLTVNTAEAAIDAVSEGIGITRVLGYQAVDALARGAVVQVLGGVRARGKPGASALSGRRASAAEAARLHRFRGAETARAALSRDRRSAALLGVKRAYFSSITLRHFSLILSLLLFEAGQQHARVLALALAELRDVGTAGGALLRRALREVPRKAARRRERQSG